MNTRFAYRLTLAAACTALTLSGQAAPADPGYVDFGKLEASSTAEFVEVQLNQNLISMVARLATQSEPEVAELLGGLRSIRVNVVGMTDENREGTIAQAKALRHKLEGSGWDRIVSVKDGEEDIGVYLKLRGDETVEGIVVTVLDGDKEAVFVNIAGDVRPEKLAMLGERFNIEPLEKIGKTMKKS